MNYLTILLCNRKPTMLSRRSKEKSQAHKEGVVGKYVKKDTPPEIPVINVWTSYSDQHQRAKKKSLQRCASSSPSCEFKPRSSSTSRNTYSCNDTQPDYYHARRAQSQMPLNNPHVHQTPPVTQFRAGSNQLSQGNSSNYVNIEQIDRMRRQQSSPLLQTPTRGFQRSYSSQKHSHPHVATTSYDADQGLLSASYANMLQIPRRPPRQHILPYSSSNSISININHSNILRLMDRCYVSSLQQCQQRIISRGIPRQGHVKLHYSHCTSIFDLSTICVIYILQVTSGATAPSTAAASIGCAYDWQLF